MVVIKPLKLQHFDLDTPHFKLFHRLHFIHLSLVFQLQFLQQLLYLPHHHYSLYQEQLIIPNLWHQHLQRHQLPLLLIAALKHHLSPPLKQLLPPLLSLALYHLPPHFSPFQPPQALIFPPPHPH